MFKMTSNKENQVPMERYMRNQFKFLGLKTPQRKAESKAYIKDSKKLPLPEVFKKSPIYTNVMSVNTNMSQLIWRMQRKTIEL